LLARNLIAYAPVAQEGNDLRSLLNRLDVLERNLRSELNRQQALHVGTRGGFFSGLESDRETLRQFTVPSTKTVKVRQWTLSAKALLSRHGSHTEKP